MASAEREPTVYNGGLVAEPTGPTPLPLPLYQFQERPLEKVGWTCPPQSTPLRLHCFGADPGSWQSAYLQVT